MLTKSVPHAAVALSVLVAVQLFASFVTPATAASQKVRVRLVTWNVAEGKPERELESLLLGENDQVQEGSEDANSESDGSVGSTLPDMVLVGLQEVTMKAFEAAMNYLTDSDLWSEKIEQTLLSRGYFTVGRVRMVGIVLVAMARHEIRREVTSIETWNIKTGLGGLFGNKGAVSLHMRLFGQGLCIINSHLAAHDDKLKQRIRDYQAIEEKRNSECDPSSDALTLWMGDLNMRIEPDPALTADRIVNMVSRNQFSELLQRDQLNNARARGVVFVNFHEPKITFRPTFKLIQGTTDYNTKRRPAWTDRILYSVRGGGQEADAVQVEVLQYKALVDEIGSDHFPVVAEYIIHVFLDEPVWNFNGSNTTSDDIWFSSTADDDSLMTMEESSGLLYFAMALTFLIILLVLAATIGYISRLSRRANTLQSG